MIANNPIANNAGVGRLGGPKSSPVLRAPPRRLESSPSITEYRSTKAIDIPSISRGTGDLLIFSSAARPA
jgi:hypothetical protein